MSSVSEPVMKRGSKVPRKTPFLEMKAGDGEGEEASPVSAAGIPQPPWRSSSADFISWCKAMEKESA